MTGRDPLVFLAGELEREKFPREEVILVKPDDFLLPICAGELLQDPVGQPPGFLHQALGVDFCLERIGGNGAKEMRVILESEAEGRRLFVKEFQEFAGFAGGIDVGVIAWRLLRRPAGGGTPRNPLRNVSFKGSG